MPRNGGSFFSELQRRNVGRVGLTYVISSWLLLQVIDVVEPIIGLPEWVAKLFLVLLAVGFPLALIFSWAYEMTPEGIRLEKDIDHSQSIAHATGQRLDKIAIGVAVTALAVLAADKYFSAEPDLPTEETAVEAAAPVEDVSMEPETLDLPSIAVLPFLNMSADENSAYFSDGLADTLLHMLAQLREIRVAARTSSFRFRDPDADITDIAEALGVSNVLEGSVQKSGNRIRVTAQLIEAESGFHLWSGNFDRDLDDIFAIQDEIAGEVVSALKVSLLGESANRLTGPQTESLDAYTEYLLGIDKLELSSTQSLAEAEQHFTKAVTMDPGYTRAWGMLGLTYLRMIRWGSAPREELLPKARNAASKVISIDENSAIGLTVLGVVEIHQGNREVADQLLHRATELDPNLIVARLHYAENLAERGHRSNAKEILKESLAIDPLSTHLNFSLAWIYRYDFEYKESLRYLDRMAEIEPLSPSSFGLRSGIEYDYGNWASAVSSMIKASELDPDDPEIAIGVAELFVALQLPEVAKSWFDHAIEVNPAHPASRSGPLILELYKSKISNVGLSLARTVLADNIDNRMGVNDIAETIIWRHALENQSPEFVLALTRERFPEYFESSAEAEDFGLSIRIAHVMRHAGMQEEAMQLLAPDIEWIRRQLETARVMQVTHLLPSAAVGERDLLLEGLRLYLRDFQARKESPGRWPVRLASTPLFDIVRDDAEYIELIDALEQRAAEQRQVLLNMYNGSYPLAN